jgi:prepilin-type N-terminal cleavage/methylation domain-containing protein
MSNRRTKPEKGFSLVEMVIATALGSTILAAAVSMYVQGVNATLTVSQRAEMQQDFRAASNILTADLSLAGAGLGTGAAIALAGASTLPRYGCDQTTACYINGTYANYPTNGGVPYLYGLLPGYTLGPMFTGNPAATDVVTVVYTDPNFYLNCYTATVASSSTVTFSTPSGFTTWAATGCLPSESGLTSPQAINDSSTGLTAGDLVLFNFGGTNIVAEVYGAATSATTATFSSGDVLHMNQSGANSLSNIAVGTTGTAQRLQVVTYYIDGTVTPSRLMRQISGHSPMPVAEGVVYMKFTYNLYNTTTGATVIGCSNPGAVSDGCSGGSTGLLPNQITTINVQNMAMDSTLSTHQYSFSGYQRMDLQTSVSARNLTYTNNYPN